MSNLKMIQAFQRHLTLQKTFFKSHNFNKKSQHHNPLKNGTTIMEQQILELIADNVISRIYISYMQSNWAFVWNREVEKLTAFSRQRQKRKRNITKNDRLVTKEHTRPCISKLASNSFTTTENENAKISNILEQNQLKFKTKQPMNRNGCRQTIDNSSKS